MTSRNIAQVAGRKLDEALDWLEVLEGDLQTTSKRPGSPWAQLQSSLEHLRQARNSLTESGLG